MAEFKKVQWTWADRSAVIVCITLLALSVYVFSPIYQGPRRHIDACPSNEKQIGLAFIQYTQDYDETWPTGNSTSGIGWAGSLWCYVKATGVFKCWHDPTIGASGNFPVSYAYNSNLAHNGHAVTNAKLNSPSDTVALSEVNGVTAPIESDPELKLYQSGQESPASNGAIGVWDEYSRGKSVMDGAAKPVTGPINVDYGGIAAHDGGANYLFTDGHVKWLTPNHVSGGLNAPSENSSGDALHAAGTGIVGNCCIDSSAPSPLLATFSTR